MKKIVLLAVALVTMTQVQAEICNDLNQQVQVEKQLDRRHHVMKDRRHHKDGNPVEFVTERMAKELNLNDAQKAQVLDLNTRYADMFRHPKHHGQKPPRGGNGCCCKGDQKPPQMDNGQDPAAPDGEKKSMDNKNKPNLDKKKPDMKAMKEKREAYDKELKTILTEDQYKLYQKQREERKANHQHKKHGAPTA